jgi:hypothetical protein
MSDGLPCAIETSLIGIFFVDFGMGSIELPFHLLPVVLYTIDGMPHALAEECARFYFQLKEFSTPLPEIPPAFDPSPAKML